MDLSARVGQPTRLKGRSRIGKATGPSLGNVSFCPVSRGHALGLYFELWAQPDICKKALNICLNTGMNE